MSSGASGAYEKPRSGGRPAWKTPEVDQHDVRLDAVPRELLEDERELAAKQPRLQPTNRRLNESKYSGRRVAIDRDVPAADPTGRRRAARRGRRRRTCSRRRSRRLARREPAHLFGQDGDVISRVARQDARQHLRHSLRSRSSWPHAARSHISRWSCRPATVTSRLEARVRDQVRRHHHAALFVGSASAAPAKK